MMKLEHSVVINRPVGVVFEFMNDPENVPLWSPGIQKYEITSEGPTDVGTTGRRVDRFLGRTIDQTWEVTEYEANHKRGIKVTSGPIPLEQVETYESVEGGTKITISTQADVGGFFKLAEPIVARMARRQQETSFANLKDLLEAQE